MAPLKWIKYLAARLGIWCEVTRENEWRLILRATIASLVAVILLEAAYNVLFHPLRRIPGPWISRISAHYLTPARFRLQRSQTIQRLHERYGSIVRVGPNEVSISDWRAYRSVYSNKNTTKTKFFYEAAKLTGSHPNIFSMQDKQQHAERRKLLKQSYSLQAVLLNESLVVDRADVLMRQILYECKHSKTGKTADICRLNALFSLEVILKCAFDHDYGETPEGDSMVMLRCMDSAAIAIQIKTALPFITRKLGVNLPGKLGELFRDWNLWESRVHDLIDDFHKHEAHLDINQKFMVSPLLLNEDHHLGRKLNSGEVREEVMAMIFAGSGTTATTLTYLLYSLARDNRIQSRLRDELQGAPEGLHHLQALPFLTAVIKETLRLFPALIGQLPRILDHDIVFDEYILPKGAIVAMQNYVHHRDPSVFHSPEDFIPERWLDAESGTKDMKSALTPFSLGPRNCIGQNLARAELYIAASKIIRSFKIRIDSQMTESDMELQDAAVGLPKGKRLLLDFEVLH